MDRFFGKKITFFCEKAILESLNGMALSSLERQAFLPSQARRVDIATGQGIALVYARKGFRSLKDCYKTPVYTHHLYMRFMAVFQTAKSLPGIHQGDALACCNLDPSSLGREWLSLHRHPIFRKLTTENQTSAITSYGL